MQSFLFLVALVATVATVSGFAPIGRRSLSTKLVRTQNI